MIWVSPTDVRNFTICPWLVYYQKVLKKPYRLTSSQLARGSFEHDYRKRMNSQLIKDDSDIVKTSEIAAREAYDFSLRNQGAQYSDSITEHYETIKATERIRSNVDDHRSHPVIESEKYLKCTFELESCQFGLRGYVDAIVKDQNQHHIPLDYKTGSSVNVEADVNQVISYALLMQENGYGPVPSILIHYVRENQKISVMATEERKEGVLEILRSVHNLIESRNEPDIRPLGIEHCNRCHYRQSCEERVLV